MDRRRRDGGATAVTRTSKQGLRLASIILLEKFVDQVVKGKAEVRVVGRRW
jgi:hypothetical protein